MLFFPQIPILKQVEKSARPDFLAMVNELADSRPELDGKERYIGIQGKSSFMLVSTPEGVENRGYVSRSELFDFYGPEAE